MESSTVWSPRGWTIGFSGWHEMVLSHPPRFLSSQRCMKCSPVRGRHILLPETVSVGPPPLPPLMAVWLRVTRASPLWRGPLPCNCALTPPFPGLQALVGSYRQGLLGLWRSRIHLKRYCVVAGPPGQSTEGPARGWS